MKLVNTIPTTTENQALLPRKASSPWRGGLVVRAAALSLVLGLVAAATSAATGGVSTTSLSSKTHAGRFESPKGGKYGNVKVKDGETWADLKGSDKVGSYPYPKNKPDKYPYWDNLGADWFYGGIWVYADKYSGHPNVWKEDKKYKWDE